MRPSTNPARWLRSERVLAVQPEPKNAGSAGWRRRIRSFPGRSLSHLALEAEQEQRGGRLALRGQMLTAGVVAGLEVDFDRQEKKTLRIAPGLGLATSGEDVTLARELVVAPEELLVWGTRNPAVPGSVDVTLANLAQRPRALVLVLRPVEILAREGADPGDPCEDDPAADAFLDHQRVDGALPMWVRLPETIATIARDAADPTVRNRLAHAIFQREADAGKRDVPVRDGEEAALPWEDAGVAIALVGFDAAGLVQYADRHAVARRGGKARPRSSLLLQTGPRGLFQGTTALWQARIDQLGDHILDLLEANRWQPGLVYRSFSFTPPAGVLPLDLVLDVAGPTRRQKLFPPHAAVEWAPIAVEQLDAALAASASLARIDLARRFQVRMLLPVPERVYEPRLLLQEEPNQELLARKAEIALALGKARYLRDRLFAQTSDLHAYLDGTRPDAPDEPGADPVETELPEDQRPEVPAAPDHLAAAGRFWAEIAGLGEGAGLKSRLATGGILSVRDELVRIADTTEDTIELGFLRGQASIYRARQLMLGNDVVTQLAISPALAGIVRGSAIEASAADMERVLAKVAPAVSVKAVKALSREPAVPITGAAGRPVAVMPPPQPPGVAVEEIAFEPRRSLKIGGRPVEALPVMTREGAKANKYEAVVAMASIAGQGTELGLDGLFGDIQVTVPRDEPDPTGTTTQKSLAYLAQQTDLRTLLERYALDEAKVDEIVADQPLDEGRVLNGGVRLIEDAIAVLRQFELRMARLRRIIAMANGLVVKLQGWIGEVSARLAGARKGLAEARHDHAVAVALVSEDAAEVLATNERRRQVLREHVRFAAFVRPRTEDLIDDAPGRDLESPEELPVLACFREELGSIPAEIRQAVDLVRRAPLAWLPTFHPLIDSLDDRPTLAHMVKSTVQLAPLTMVAKAETQVKAEALSIARDLQAGFTVMQAQLGERDEKVRTLDVSQVERLSWSALRAQALEVVTFADFAHIGHLRPDVLRRATAAVDGITRVATCLYRRFAEVRADIRLAWAQEVSVFDEATGLRDLLILPRFHEIEAGERAAMQALVDWLFSQIAALPRPRAMMNNLVRVCLLLASHAPVRALLRGKIGRTTVSVGHVIQIRAVDVAKARIGMNVLVNAPAGRTAAARAVVEDVCDEYVTARVFATSAPNVDLPDGTEALLGEAEHLAAGAMQVLAPSTR